MDTKIENPEVGSVFVVNTIPVLFGRIEEVYNPDAETVWDKRGRCLLENGVELHSTKLRHLNDPAALADKLRQEAMELLMRYQFLHDRANEIETKEEEFRNGK